MAATASRWPTGGAGPGVRSPSASLAPPPLWGGSASAAASAALGRKESSEVEDGQRRPGHDTFAARLGDLPRAGEEPSAPSGETTPMLRTLADVVAANSSAVTSELATPAPSAGGSDAAEWQPREYRVYVETILRPLRPESVLNAARARGGHGVGNREGCSVSGRVLLEEALTRFIMQMRSFVTGCDDRKLSKAALRRARGIESQLGVMSERIVATLLKSGALVAEDLHGIWHGFSIVRGWRDVRVPQECLLQMLRGALAELADQEAEEWTNQALTWELTLPEVHQAISVSAWPPLSELLGRLPDCVTPADIQEALWQQSFVENPTHAPDHRNYRRFAMLSAQMVAIGVELESDKVELLVQQTLELDRPWRERRDMLSGILSAASVEDRQRVVRHLDRRFEEHADIDDFEIVCGIAETVGVEIPRDGAIRRCALRRWALDAKRGGALPVSRLIDFVDCDAAIGEDVANSLRAKGRVADAAVLLGRLPQEIGLGGGDCRGVLEVSNGDAELARLRELLAQEDNTVEGQGVFEPMEEGAFRVPLDWADTVGCTTCTYTKFSGVEKSGFSDDADGVNSAVARLKGSRMLGISFWKEEAPFWYSPVTLLGLCTEDRVELIDLVGVRNDISGGWPHAANQLRGLFSDPLMLKVYYGDDYPQIFAYTLGMGVANTLKRGDREPLGPSLNLQALVADMLGTSPGENYLGEVEPWPRVARRYLGVRLCLEEAGSNWARRPLRVSQLHHAAAEAWTQLPVLRAICAYGIIPRTLIMRHLCIQEKVRIHATRLKFGKGHALGQIAPVGRLMDLSAFGFGVRDEKPTLAAIQAQTKAAANGTSTTDGATSAQQFGGSENDSLLPMPTRIAVLSEAVPASAAEDGEHLEELSEGTFVEVFDERFGGLATVAPLSDLGARRRVPTVALLAANGWALCPAWVSKLPRPTAEILEKPREPLQETFGRSRRAEKEKKLTTVMQNLAPERAALAEQLVDDLYNADIAEALLQSMYDAQ